MAYGLTYTKHLETMMDVLRGSLTDAAPHADPPAGTLKVTLRAHQLAALGGMERMERSLQKGMDCSGEVVFSNYAILGDSVGVGKSLMVLGHIARLNTLDELKGRVTLGAHSSNDMFSLCSRPIHDISEGNALIIVPHTLFRQWADYIKNQTHLSALYLDKKRALQSPTFAQDVLRARVVLVSNTLYREFSVWQRDNSISWKRVFIDEADTIHLVNGYPAPQTRFLWFITASWMNMLFSNESVYFPNSALGQLVAEPNAPYHVLFPYFKESYSAIRPYTYLRHYVTSYNYFRNILNSYHRLRGRLILRCSDQFVQQSISLPPLHRRNVLCRAPITQRIVAEAVPSEIQNLLHGGDVEGAISALGVKAEDTTSLVEAVTKNLQKELDRLKATYAFKSSIEYTTQQGKEAALKSLEEKMKQKEDAIKALQERIENFKNEMCPICYDEPQSALLTPCCSRVFCGQCILTCLTRANTCPMCRHVLQAKDLIKVISAEEKNAIVPAGGAVVEKPEDGLEKKPDALLRIFRENPKGRFLVFSRYDNPFTTIEAAVGSLGVRVKQLKGNKDAIAATLRGFQSDEIRCLLLNSHYAGSGLNITAATHVVLLHAMTHEEEKQNLGRAHRLGRSEPLHFIRLLHEDEMPTVN